MKIFMSHSSRQKLFVKALRQHLPASMSLWIDERELRVGADIDDGLETAVRQACDFFILVVDRNANESEWVQKEITWAIQREKDSGQTFLLPIVVEPEAWDGADPRIRNRKFLTLADFTDESIAAVGRALTSEIFDWLSMRLSSEKTLSPGQLERRSNAELLKSADQLTSDLADRIKLALLPYRSSNPAELHEFAALLRNHGVDIEDAGDLYDVLERLNGMHLLNGVEFDEDYVFLSRENFDYKATLYTEVKKRMARVAAQGIVSGSVIALDGGSSVLAVANVLARRLHSGSLSDISVVTNSVPAASVLLDELSHRGAGDRDRSARVFLLGGYARPTSLTTVPIEYSTANRGVEDPTPIYDRILDLTGPLDIAFLGANGVYESEGLGTRNPYETIAKRWMLNNAKERIVLFDPTKLDIPQFVPFASFSDRLRMITSHSDEYQDQIDRFRSLLDGTSSTLEVIR